MRGNKQWMKKNNWPMSHLMNLNLDFDNNNKKIKNDCVGDSGKTYIYIYIRHVLLKTRAMDVILWYLLFKMTNWKPLRIFFLMFTAKKPTNKYFTLFRIHKHCFKSWLNSLTVGQSKSPNVPLLHKTIHSKWCKW